MKLTKAQRTSIDKIKSLGFGYLKVELEAELDREYGSTRHCSYCDDDGDQMCELCSSSGWIDSGNPEEDGLECSYCEGRGHHTCEVCGGEEQTDWSDDECETFLLDRLTPEEREAIKYSKFYRDGTVDSEFTFTIPIDRVDVAMQLIRAMNRLSEEVGNGIETERAGMHISIMPSENVNHMKPLPRGLIDNFADQVQKLMPSLYFLASHKNDSRDLEYRMPIVSHQSKYSAIYTHGRQMIEYRIFEPCFEQPEALLDKIEVIAKTLRYYSKETVKVEFANIAVAGGSRKLDKFFLTPEAITALNKTLRYLKPEGKTLKQLKTEREFALDKKTLRDELKRKHWKAWLKYKQNAYSDNYSDETPMKFYEYCNENVRKEAEIRLGRRQHVRNYL